MTAYYNEIDPYAAQWLRNLIAAGHIAPGDVDERSIKDVRADDLKGYTQCHFFAGIGVWSHALRLAGWSDDRPVWTGSCPCQPFSAAGKQQGTSDDRHLWPAWFSLIEKCDPPVVFGEQVEAAIRHGWLDLVQADLEGIGYAVAAAGIPAAGFGAPHIRQRLWFVADTSDIRCKQRGDTESAEIQGQCAEREREHSGPKQAGELPWRSERLGRPSVLGRPSSEGLEGLGSGHQAEAGRDGAVRPVAAAGESVRLEHGESDGRIERRAESSGRGAASGRGIGGLANNQHAGSSRAGVEPQSQGAQQQSCHLDREESTTRPRPTNGHWRDADWLHCRDGKWRPVEPGTFPLAHGAAARVGRLRAYGNAIVPQVAAAFIEAYNAG